MDDSSQSASGRARGSTVFRRRAISRSLLVVSLFCLAAPAHASIFKGEALDQVADIMAWVVLVIAPVIAIAIFWMVHILPEKIAEKRHHPQAKAIQTLCLLSLFFGGLLWPLAWLWAYTKPVLHRMAYGTDRGEHEPGPAEAVRAEDDAMELKRLRARVAELEGKIVNSPANSAGGT